MPVSSSPSPGYKSGFVTIAGRPNTGKSTFLNCILGRKVAIVTHKPQTTRTRILGVLHQPGGQIVFLDTPGIHEPGSSRLNRAMVRTARDACRDVDLLLFFVDLPHGLTQEDLNLLHSLPVGKAPIFLVLNKMDRIDRAELLPVMARVAHAGQNITRVFPISALNNDNLEPLLARIIETLPPGPPYFPEGQISDQPETFIIAEVIREKLFLSLHQELPYVLGVRVETFEERQKPRGMWNIGAVIMVERDSHKGIVIGKKGGLLKRVGTRARLELEELLGLQLHLNLWVQVKSQWRENSSLLRSMGYPDQLEADE
ncbi:MAG: GTPase Era [Magnetococcales bacterium]|nr:GTPase Era [Magnetococcales bacterium]MBF0150054.1 GTPase Era [Magnetococcales bacterium]